MCKQWCKTFAMESPLLKQAWTMSAVLINMVGQGILLSYSSCLLPALLAPDSTIKTDLHTASWLSSSVGVAGMFGFLLASVLMDPYGRKRAQLLAMIPGVIGWLLVYFAKDVATLMVGRILGGINAAASASIGAVVAGEYSAPKYRGMFLNMKTASVGLGALIVHALSHFCHWRTIALYALILHFVAFGIIFTWSESPAWLITRRQYDKSENTFYWLRGKSEESRREIEAMIEAHNERMVKPVVENQSVIQKMLIFLKKFTRREFLRPVFILSIGIILLEMCGRHFFGAYAPQIIGEMTGSKTQSFYYTLCLDVIITTSAVCSSILIKIMKRRTLLFSTGFPAFLVLMTVCTYLFLDARDLITKDYPWIPISLCVIYFILANLGCTPIPLALLGELYPVAYREAGTAVTGVWISFCVMVVLQITPHFLISFQVYGTFAIYGIVMGISLVILYLTLPETKDRTLQEIEDYFIHGKFFDNKVGDDDEEAKVKMMKKT